MSEDEDDLPASASGPVATRWRVRVGVALLVIGILALGVLALAFVGRVVGDQEHCIQNLQYLASAASDYAQPHWRGRRFFVTADARISSVAEAEFPKILERARASAKK